MEGSKTIPVIVEIKKVYIHESLVKDKESIKIDTHRPTLARVGNGYFELGNELKIEKTPI